MSDEIEREPAGEIEVDPELDGEAAEDSATWLPSVDEAVPVEADPADWIDQQRAVPEDLDERPA